MIVLRELAPSKINLYLHVTGRREDNYHLLDSWVCFASLGDKLEVSASNIISLARTGPYATYIPEKENSIIKAALALKKLCEVESGAALTIQKNLPVGAGMGGGSTDAAATLRLLTRFWKVQLKHKDLQVIALTLGADVPACLHAGSLYMSGIGEVIEPAPALTALFAVLANPGKTLLTADVFAHYKGDFSKPTAHPVSFASAQERIDFLRHTRNDLQDTAIDLVPEIAETLMAISAQKDCLLSRMSGSGATCFGLFYSLTAAQAAAANLSAQHPAWWIHAIQLH